jgi:hypothetical protein
MSDGTPIVRLQIRQGTTVIPVTGRLKYHDGQPMAELPVDRSVSLPETVRLRSHDLELERGHSESHQHAVYRHKSIVAVPD